jgi:hypothetical protein
LEPNPFDQLKLWTPIYSLIKNIFYNIKSNIDDFDDIFTANYLGYHPSAQSDEGWCDNKQFDKLKYVSNGRSKTDFQVHYEAKPSPVIKDKILLEIRLNLDPFKQQSIR